MDRLSDYDAVAITLPADAALRDGWFKCQVIAMSGLTAALEPIDRGELLWLPSRIEGSFMTFRHERTLVALKGTLTQSGTVSDLRFRVSDGVHMPRSRASRSRICLPIALRRKGSEQRLQGLTVDLSADGVLVECGMDAHPGEELELELALPGHDDPVEAGAMVVRGSEGLIAVRISLGSRDARTRLARFVAENNRAVLHRQRVAADFDFDF
jgi:PilZ domain-containing protein